MKKENNKYKELYSKLKEDWKDPRKKAGIKLLGYFIFFFILLLIASITNSLNSNQNVKNTTPTTTIQVDKYIDKQNDLLTGKYTVSYVININNDEYKINGTLNNNIVNGYLESVNDIKKIVIKDSNIYEIVNNDEILLETEINKDFLNVSYIINLVKQNSALIDNDDNIKTYTYNLQYLNSKIIVITNENYIKEIKIENEISSYVLNFDK